VDAATKRNVILLTRGMGVHVNYAETVLPKGAKPTCHSLRRLVENDAVDGTHFPERRSFGDLIPTFRGAVELRCFEQTFRLQCLLDFRPRFDAREIGP
jgi:hypothetical protein